MGIRTFDTGATRNSDEGKLDYEACLSPLVLKAYAEYKRKHRLKPDGTVRKDDNWQKGIPLDSYMKSMWRHFHDVWMIHRGWYPASCDTNMHDALCAIIFNASGYLHRLIELSEYSPSSEDLFLEWCKRQPDLTDPPSPLKDPHNSSPDSNDSS